MVRGYNGPAQGEFPSGQRGRAVNPLALPSEVRILSPPPLDEDLRLFLGRTARVKRLLVFALLVLATGCGESSTQAPRSAEPFDWSALDAGWTELPAPPSPAACAVSVWTGRELLYWGGDESCHEGPVHAAGAAFDPATRAWRALPPSPIGGRSSAVAVWTGEELIVWGGWNDGDRGDGAAYRPSTDEWRTLSESPLEPRVAVAAVWTGREMIVWGDASRSGESVEGAAYDPSKDSWRSLPRAPNALNQAQAIWTGTEMVIYGSLLDGNNHSERPSASGLAYDPAADTWREIARYPLSPQASMVVWTGREMVAWDYELRSGAYDPAADAWRPLPDLPLEFYECYPDGALADERFVLAWHCGQATILELATDTWRELPRPPESVIGTAVNADDVVLFAGAWAGVGNTLWAYRPGPLGPTAFVPDTERRGERDFLPLTFPDGRSIVLSHPLELDLAGMTVEPAVSYLYRADRPPRFELEFFFGPADAAGGQSALSTRSWTVLAQLRDSGETDTIAESLRVRETADGFPVVEASDPIALSDESGEGGGPNLQITLRGDRWIELSVEPACVQHGPDIGGGAGGWCLGDYSVVAYGDRPFIEAVFQGLRLEQG
jgi:hypothetical protein